MIAVRSEQMSTKQIADANVKAFKFIIKSLQRQGLTDMIDRDKSQDDMLWGQEGGGK